MEDSVIAVGEHVGGADLVVRQGSERLLSTCEDMSQLTSRPLIRLFLFRIIIMLGTKLLTCEAWKEVTTPT